LKQPIVVCIPRLKPHEKHLEHFREWYADNQKKHNLIPVCQYYRALHHAQKAAVYVAFHKDASHILFSEDDQWGYPVDGLDVLLEADKDVIGFRTYKRAYPHSNLCMRKESPGVSMILPVEEQVRKAGRLIPFGLKRGEPLIQRTDLISWAFTLVKVDVFRKMQKAWGNLLVSQKDLKALMDGDEATRERLSEYVDKPLGLSPFRQWGPHPTDSFFCQYCEDLGIERWVHFGYTIGHGDVEPEEILMARRKHEAKKFREEGYSWKPESVENEDDWGNVYGPNNEHMPERYRVMMGEHNGESQDGAEESGGVGEEEACEEEGKAGRRREVEALQEAV